MQFKNDQMVAQAACGGDIAKAKRLPQQEYDFYLQCVTAENQAEPARREFERERDERRAEEDKERRELMNER